MSLSASRLGKTFFAEVENIDIRQPLADAAIDAINEALAEHAILLFSAPGLTDEEQIAFTKRFGELEDGRLRVGRERNPTSQFIGDMSNVDADGNLIPPDSEKVMFQKGNELWHSDSSFKPVPPGPSLLSARIIPSKGGNTEFADLRAAWEALPPDRQAYFDGLIGEHSLQYSRERYGYCDFNADEMKQFPPVQQPLVRTHPMTGRKNLFTGAHVGRIIGMDRAESEPILQELLEFATQPEFVYIHKWSVGDLVMWDNRCVLHRAQPYPVESEVRVLRRTTVQGVRPIIVEGKPINEYAVAQSQAA